MRSVVLCPSCKAKLTIRDEQLAKALRCPKCKAVFKLPAGAASRAAEEPKPPASAPGPVKLQEPTEDEMPGWMSAALAEQREVEIEEEQEDEEEEQQEEQQLAKDEKRGLRNVRRGIRCVLLGTLIPFVSALAAAGFLMHGKDALVTAVTVYLFGNALGGLLSIFGGALCCTGPRRAGGKVLAGAATALTFIAVAIGAYLTFSSLEVPNPGEQHRAERLQSRHRAIFGEEEPAPTRQQTSETVQWISGGYFLATAFAMYCWLLFLHNTCSHLRARRTGIAVVIFGLAATLWVLFVIVTLYETRPQDLIGRHGEVSLELLGIVVGGLAVLLGYCCLLAVLAGVVGREYRKR